MNQLHIERETKISRITAEIITSIMDDINQAGEFGTLIQLIEGTHYLGVLDGLILPLDDRSDSEIDQLYDDLITKGAEYPWQEEDYYSTKESYLGYLAAVNGNDEWLKLL